MTNYKYGIWSGLWFVIGFAIWTAYIDNLSSDSAIAFFIVPAVAIIIGGSALLLRSERNSLYNNVTAMIIVTFIGWLALIFGIGILFSPLFKDVSDSTVVLLYYFFAGPWLVIFNFLGSIIAIIIHKVRCRKDRNNKL